MFLKRFIREWVFSIKFWLVRNKGIAVYMYHSVGNNRIYFNVEPKSFARQMKYLKDNNYQVISLAKLVELMKSDKPLPKKTVVLTFDDGYHDNYVNAWPILKKYNFPATIFLATGFIGREIKSSEGISLKILDWPEIKKMHQSELIDFEPHTHNHIKLDRIDLNKAELEIIKSKKIIEEELNKKCCFFAYPKGRYNNRIIEILKNNNFKAARTVENGYTYKKDDLFRLKKITVRSVTSLINFKLTL